MSSTDQIYHLAASRLGDKFNWSMTLGELLHNKTLLVIFYFLNITAIILPEPLLLLTLYCLLYGNSSQLGTLSPSYNPETTAI